LSARTLRQRRHPVILIYVSPLKSILPFLIIALFSAPLLAGPEGGDIPFKEKDALIDVSDALRSKQYVHRAILSTLVRDTAGFGVGRFYINHLMGFSNVWQRGTVYTKYSTGLQGASFGYLTSGGHGLELGLEISTVSNLQLGYRYFIRPKDFSMWGFAGLGVGSEVSSLSFADGPPQARLYSGPKQMAFATFGLLIPVIDVGLKAETRFSFYGTERIILTTGVGMIVFL
jgi:hypothetical protein